MIFILAVQPVFTPLAIFLRHLCVGVVSHYEKEGASSAHSSFPHVLELKTAGSSNSEQASVITGFFVVCA